MRLRHSSDNTSKLAKVPLFASLPKNELKELANLLSPITYPVGTTLFRVGDPGDTMFIIASGSIRFFNRDPLGKEIALEEINNGFFGEVAVLAGGVRTATAQVTVELDALELHRTDLEKFLKRHPRASMLLMGDMARRLSRAGDQMRQMIPLNINSAWEKAESPLDRSIHRLAEHCASLPFLLGNVLFSFLWIVLNLALKSRAFDHPPFSWLSLIITLEALSISTIVLYSQNQQASKEKVRNEVEFSANLDSALIIAGLKDKMEEMEEKLDRDRDARNL